MELLVHGAIPSFVATCKACFALAVAALPRLIVAIQYEPFLTARAKPNLSSRCSQSHLRLELAGAMRGRSGPSPKQSSHPL